MEKTSFDLLYEPDYLELPSYMREGDYWEDGMLHCGTCRKPRQTMVNMPGGLRKLRCKCRCEQEQDWELQQRQIRENFILQMERMQQDRISDLSYRQCRFSDDDHMDEDSFRICRTYTENWEEMRKHNFGMLLYGTVGSGKTFRAGCVVNALLEQLVPATVTSFPRLLNLLQDSRDRQELLDQLNRYELLVIDDLGVERDSAYALEQVYNIIDSRAKSGKPLIITTNLTLQELKNPANLAYARIYDRILELCPVALKMTGDSRRAEKAKEKRALARKLLEVGAVQ